MRCYACPRFGRNSKNVQAVKVTTADLCIILLSGSRSKLVLTILFCQFNNTTLSQTTHFRNYFFVSELFYNRVIRLNQLHDSVYSVNIMLFY